MSRLHLNANAYARLQAQVSLSGTFHHTLYSTDHSKSVVAKVEIEQCTKGITAMVRIAHTQNTCVTLDNSRKDNAKRIASFIEGVANGRLPIGIPEFGEDEVVSQIEQTLRQAIRLGRGTYYMTADDLEPCLLINRTSRGYAAKIELEEVTAIFTLPADTQRAYALLEDNLRRFLQGYRDSFAAAA